MGDLSEDLERCLCDCACDAQATARAKTSCSEGRVRETKRILLGERQRLLAELHASQRGIDTIDHILYRVSSECVPASQRGTGASGAPCFAPAKPPAPAPQDGEVSPRG